MSSMTEALIPEVFKRPVLWDHRIKDYHNRTSLTRNGVTFQTLNISSKYLHMYLVYTQIHI